MHLPITSLTSQHGSPCGPSCDGLTRRGRRRRSVLLRARDQAAGPARAPRHVGLSGGRSAALRRDCSRRALLRCMLRQTWRAAGQLPASRDAEDLSWCAAAAALPIARRQDRKAATGSRSARDVGGSAAAAGASTRGRRCRGRQRRAQCRLEAVSETLTCGAGRASRRTWPRTLLHLRWMWPGLARATWGTMHGPSGRLARRTGRICQAGGRLIPRYFALRHSCGRHFQQAVRMRAHGAAVAVASEAAAGSGALSGLSGKVVSPSAPGAAIDFDTRAASSGGSAVAAGRGRSRLALFERSDLVTQVSAPAAQPLAAVRQCCAVDGGQPRELRRKHVSRRRLRPLAGATPTAVLSKRCALACRLRGTPSATRCTKGVHHACATKPGSSCKNAQSR